MATTYTWNIPKKNAFTIVDGVLVHIRYNISASDGTNTVERNSLVKISAETVATITDIFALTESQVIDIVKTSLGEKTITILEKNLELQLSKKSAPTKVVTSADATWA
jgi:hypothetical protein